MNRLKSLFLLLFLLLLPYSAVQSADPHPLVTIQTNLGDIVVKLDREHAPGTVDNFLRYVQEGFYDNTIFHRVIRNFMIQGGGFTPDFKRKQTYAPIKNEADNGLKNKRGTIAMARTGMPHTATAQFFINVVNNKKLDHTRPTLNGWGYTVFGEVVSGMDVVDKIRKIRTGSGGPFPRDVPVKPVIIKKISMQPPK